MRCVNCRNPIYIKYNFINLFKSHRQRLCQHCFDNHYNDYPYFVYPVGVGFAHIFELGTQVEKPDLFDEYYQAYLEIYTKINAKTDLLIIDQLDHHLLAMLDQFKFENLIILTISFKEE